MREVTRPIVRYHGGKFMLADWIISHFPDHVGYTEGYGGGASVLLKKRPAFFEVYNDLDGEIVNIFRMCRDRGPALIEILELTPFSREEFEKSYEPTTDPLEWARRSIYRSMAAFASAGISGAKTGFRSNNNKGGNGSAGQWRNYPGQLPAIIERLRNVIIENKPALEIIRQHDAPRVLHYLDPPYKEELRNPKWATKSYRFEMKGDQHLEMLGTIQQLKGFVILSGYDNPMYNEELKGWRKSEKITMADGARKRKETLWLSPNVPITNKLF